VPQQAKSTPDFDIDGDGSGGLDYVGVDERAFRMGEVAEGLEIVLVAGGAGDERYGDEARVLLDEFVEVVEVDAVVAWSDDCYRDALLLELSVHGEGGVVVEGVGDDSGVGAEAESGAEHVLPAHGAGDDGDLGCSGVDETSEGCDGGVARVGARPGLRGIVHAGLQESFGAVVALHAEWVRERSVEECAGEGKTLLVGQFGGSCEGARRRNGGQGCKP
jgi:hypothetical protein